MSVRASDFSSYQLFGSHIGHGSNQGALGREHGVNRQTAFWEYGPPGCLCEVEIHQLCPGSAEHDVARFDIAVQNATPVRLVERFRDLHGPEDRFIHRKRPVF